MAISDEDLKEFINLSMTETVIRNFEDQILGALKLFYETYPIEENDKNWADYSEFVVKRRLKK